VICHPRSWVLAAFCRCSQATATHKPAAQALDHTHQQKVPSDLVSAPAATPLPSLNTPSCPLPCGSPTRRLRENSRAPPDLCMATQEEVEAGRVWRWPRRRWRDETEPAARPRRRSQSEGHRGRGAGRPSQRFTRTGLLEMPSATTPEPSTNVPTRASISAGHCKRISSPAFSCIRPGAHTRLAAKQLRYERLDDRVSSVAFVG